MLSSHRLTILTSSRRRMENSMDSQTGRPRIEPSREAMAATANDKDVIACRSELARCSASHLEEAGTELHVIGHLIGPDRAQGRSPFGHGNDETVAVSV